MYTLSYKEDKKYCYEGKQIYCGVLNIAQGYKGENLILPETRRHSGRLDTKLYETIFPKLQTMYKYIIQIINYLKGSLELFPSLSLPWSNINKTKACP